MRQCLVKEVPNITVIVAWGSIQQCTRIVRHIWSLVMRYSSWERVFHVQIFLKDPVYSPRNWTVSHSYLEQFSICGSIMERVLNRTAYWEFLAAELGMYCRRHKSVPFIVSLRTNISRDVAVDAGFGTYSMEQSPSWEANLSLASQEIPRILWNQNVHYRIHKRPSPVPILSQLDPAHTYPSHLLKICFILPSTLRSSKWFVYFRSPHQTPVCTSPVLHTCHLHRALHSSSSDHQINIFYVGFLRDKVTRFPFPEIRLKEYLAKLRMLCCAIFWETEAYR